MDEVAEILTTPGTGLERVGLKKSTSIIEKLTMYTYNSTEQEDDATILKTMTSKETGEDQDQGQDISPERNRKVSNKPVLEQECDLPTPTFDLQEDHSSS